MLKKWFALVLVLSLVLNFSLQSTAVDMAETSYKSIYTKFINDDLIEYYNNNMQGASTGYNTFDADFYDAFMIDIDNDSSPELLVLFGAEWIEGIFFKYENGEFRVIDGIDFYFVGGGSAGTVFCTILQDDDGKTYVYKYSSARLKYGENSSWSLNEEGAVFENGELKKYRNQVRR